MQGMLHKGLPEFSGDPLTCYKAETERSVILY